MSNDDFCVDSKKLLDDYLNQIEGGFGLLIEHIDPSALPHVKHAFLEGYKLGFEKKTIKEWQEQNQK